jgi:KDO2-lipid IV(A) lauroyltransferase
MRCFINLVWNAVDFLYFSRRDAGALSAVCEVRGNEHLERALRKGTGVLCVSAHVGNWELLPARVAHMGFRVAVVARKLYYPKLDQWVNSLRRRMGVEVLDRDDPPGRIFSRLRRGYVVGVLTDQDTRTRGVFVEFFGRPANTPVGPALIAMRSGSPIMPVFIRRMPGHSYQVAFGEECTSRGPATLKGAETLTQWATGRIEEAIRSSPEQWVWMHRRWRRRPKDTG